MAEFYGSALCVNFNGTGGSIDLTADFRQVTFTPTIQMDDKSTGAEVYKTYLTGQKDFTVSYKGLYQSGTAALGASLDGRHTVLLCGDLTFLHDSNALLSAHQHPGDFTIVVVNNQGGGIFNHLAIAEKNPHFEKIWATPQNVRIGQLCAAHGVRHQTAENFAELRKFLEVRGRGVRVIEFWTNRQKDAQHRRQGFRS